jgi:hypothetical protein
MQTDMKPLRVEWFFVGSIQRTIGRVGHHGPMAWYALAKSRGGGEVDLGIYRSKLILIAAMVRNSNNVVPIRRKHGSAYPRRRRTA